MQSGVGGDGSDATFDETLGDASDGHTPLDAVEADPEQLRADLEHDVAILERWREGARAVDVRMTGSIESP